MKIPAKKTLVILGAILSLLIVAAAINYFIWQNNYQGRFYPGESLGGISLKGKTREETKKELEEKIAAVSKSGIQFQYNAQKEILDINVVSFDSDLSRPTLAFETEKSLSLIFNPTDRNKYLPYLISLFKNKAHKTFAPIYTLDEEAIKSFLNDNFKDLIISPENAYFSLKKSNPAIVIAANQEKIGKGIDYDKIFNDIHSSLARLEMPDVTIKTVSLYPEIKQADLAGLEEAAKAIAGRGELVLSFYEAGAASSTTKYWRITPEKLTSWIGLTKEKNQTIISLNQNKVIEYLKSEVAPEVDLEAVLPRFEIKNGKVSSWQTGENGRIVDLEMTAQAITDKLLNGQNQAELVMKIMDMQETMPENELRIKDLLGTGHSKFTGSSNNRRKNIKTGADALHGILIKPEEEFSLIKTLGTIDASTGYVAELVIKGNKTVPEFGGGLCQIGTTIFRTALSTGLPITMRQNHSYRVSYYEPAGTDATIYDPLPDLRFVNDTGNYILIQARIANDDLYFDFWGTNDGRIATTTYPTIYNIVKPAATKIIETTDLKPGQKKCTESSHNGADAFFDYTVTYQGATSTRTVEKRFSSHYVPWQGVCLTGVAASSTPQAATSSTPTAGIPVISSSSPNIQN
jgi:vancomycin resistance protein YoaR